MKLVHMDAPPQRKMVRAAAAALSAFFLSACAASTVPPAHPSPSTPLIPQSMQSSAAPSMDASESPGGRRSLLSSWDRGRCVFENGRDISYSDDLDSRQRSLRLDSDARGARSVLCSEEFTVLMLPDRAIISLGGRGVLEGARCLA